MIRVDEIRGLMAKKGVKGVSLARAMNIAPKTFYEKMRKGKFASDEIEVFIEQLEIDDPMPIFFARV